METVGTSRSNLVRRSPPSFNPRVLLFLRVELTLFRMHSRYIDIRTESRRCRRVPQTVDRVRRLRHSSRSTFVNSDLPSRDCRNATASSRSTSSSSLLRLFLHAVFPLPPPFLFRASTNHLWRRRRVIRLDRGELPHGWFRQARTRDRWRATEALFDIRFPRHGRSFDTNRFRTFRR